MLKDIYILEVLNRIFRDKLGDQSININLDTKADDILEWNSLNHLILILEIEKFFQIKFNPIELANMQNVREMTEVIKKLVHIKN